MKCKTRLLALDLEPTHYKTDLWNAFEKSKLFDSFVIYTQSKNWAPDGGHNYTRLPEAVYKYKVVKGKGIKGVFLSCITVIQAFKKDKFDIVFISGYVNAPTLLGIVICATFKINYIVHADVFNRLTPSGNFKYLKELLRDAIRQLIFKTAKGVLTCGKLGKESAIAAGCDVSQVFDFPYVVDVNRILNDAPVDVPVQCASDLKNNNTVIFFSGRMIKRKGLDTLIEAVDTITDMGEWVLWIEGDGPDFEKYQQLVGLHKLDDRCRFLGFCQPDVHSWLLRNSNIVVVPSHSDSWGMLVDEGMQLGKIVISSDQTGSGADRIIDGKNGYIFPAGDSISLSRLIKNILSDEENNLQLGINAKKYAKLFSPKKNVIAITSIVGKI